MKQNVSYQQKRYYASQKTFQNGYSSVSPERAADALNRKIQQSLTNARLARNAKISSWVMHFEFVVGTPDKFEFLDQPEVLFKLNIYSDKTIKQQKEYLEKKGYGDLKEYLFEGRLSDGKKKTNKWRAKEFEKMGLIFEKQTAYYYRGVNEEISNIIKQHGSQGLGINNYIFKNDDIPSYCYKSKPNLLENL